MGSTSGLVKNQTISRGRILQILIDSGEDFQLVEKYEAKSKIIHTLSHDISLDKSSKFVLSLVYTNNIAKKGRIIYACVNRFKKKDRNHS